MLGTQGTSPLREGPIGFLGYKRHTLGVPSYVVEASHTLRRPTLALVANVGRSLGRILDRSGPGDAIAIYT